MSLPKLFSKSRYPSAVIEMRDGQCVASFCDARRQCYTERWGAERGTGLAATGAQLSVYFARHDISTTRSPVIFLLPASIVVESRIAELDYRKHFTNAGTWETRDLLLGARAPTAGWIPNGVTSKAMDWRRENGGLRVCGTSGGSGFSPYITLADTAHLPSNKAYWIPVLSAARLLAPDGEWMLLVNEHGSKIDLNLHSLLRGAVDNAQIHVPKPAKFMELAEDGGTVTASEDWMTQALLLLRQQGVDSTTCNILIRSDAGQERAEQMVVDLQAHSSFPVCKAIADDAITSAVAQAFASDQKFLEQSPVWLPSFSDWRLRYFNDRLQHLSRRVVFAAVVGAVIGGATLAATVVKWQMSQQQTYQIKDQWHSAQGRRNAMLDIVRLNRINIVKIEKINTLIAARNRAGILLDTLAKGIPDDAVIHKLEWRAKGLLYIQGSAFSPITVARLVAKLSRTQMVSKVTIRDISSTQQDGVRIYKFRIHATLKDDTATKLPLFIHGLPVPPPRALVLPAPVSMTYPPLQYPAALPPGYRMLPPPPTMPAGPPPLAYPGAPIPAQMPQATPPLQGGTGYPQTMNEPMPGAETMLTRPQIPQSGLPNGLNEVPQHG